MKEITLEILDKIEDEYRADKKNDIVRHALSASDIAVVAGSKDTGIGGQGYFMGPLRAFSQL